MSEAALNAKVKAVNHAHEVAHEVYRRFREALQPYLGQNVTKKDGTLLKKVADKMPEFPHQHDLMVYRNSSDYTLSWTVKTNEHIEGTHGCLYYERTVYIADIRDGVIEKFYDDFEARTDYTADEIKEKRAAFDKAEKALQEAKSALWPFAERYDR